MATSSSHALDDRWANEPVWLSDSEVLDDAPPTLRRPFDVAPGALATALDDYYGWPHETFSATIPPPPHRGAVLPAAAIAAAIVLTFGGGWWLGRSHPPPESTPNVVRVAAHSERVAVNLTPPVEPTPAPADSTRPPPAVVATAKPIAKATAAPALVAPEKPARAQEFMPDEL